MTDTTVTTSTISTTSDATFVAADTTTDTTIDIPDIPVDSNNDVVRTKVSNPNYFLKNMNIDIDDFRDFLYNPKKYF